MASSSPSLSLEEGYPVEIFKNGNVDEKFLCNFCRKVLRDPVQSFCGHRFCKSCMDKNISSGDSIKCIRCEEHGETEDDYSILQPDQIFPDKAVYREMAKLKVTCTFEGCNWKGTFKEYEEHVKECQFRPVACSQCGQLLVLGIMTEHAEKFCPERIVLCKFCKTGVRHSALEEHYNQCPKFHVKCDACGKKKIPREKMQQHLDSQCTNQKVACPVGCGEYDKTNFTDHLMSNAPVHLSWTVGESVNLHNYIKSLEDKLSHQLVIVDSKLDEQLGLLDQKIQAIEHRASESTAALSGQPELDQRMLQPIETRVTSMNDNLKTVEVKAGTFEGIANSLHRELDKTITALESLERHRRSIKEEVEDLKNKNRALERTIALKDISIAELDLRVQSLESASYDGSYIWKVTDFSKKQQEASQGRSISIYSPAFYTGHHGYKACARLYPNGDGMGKGTHLSLFFVVMRGHYDALQLWPFKQRVTFCLVNQNGGEHILDSFRPDPSSSSFKRPASDMNIASGCPLFIRLESVTNPSHGFLREDTIYIKVSVDVSDLHDPLSHPDDKIKVTPVEAR